MSFTKRDIRSFMKYDINSIEDLIDALGGDTEVAIWLGISQPAVANWKSRGQIATGWHMRLYADLRRRGRTVNPSVFGMTEREFMPLATFVDVSPARKAHAT